jgi:hypothetical protein
MVAGPLSSSVALEIASTAPAVASAATIHMTGARANLLTGPL